MLGNGRSSEKLSLDSLKSEFGFSADKPWPPKHALCVTVPGRILLAKFI
jgi:hypothetical protein